MVAPYGDYRHGSGERLFYLERGMSWALLNLTSE